MAETIRYYAPGSGLRRKRSIAPTQLRAQLHDAQRSQCYLCGGKFNKAINGLAASIDHVKPRGRGGLDERNRLLSHKRCNNIKGDRMPYPCEVLYCEAIYLALDKRK